MKFDKTDIIAAAGLLIAAVGLWWAWPPLSFIVVGAVVFLAAIGRPPHKPLIEKPETRKD